MFPLLPELPAIPGIEGLKRNKEGVSSRLLVHPDSLSQAKFPPFFLSLFEILPWPKFVKRPNVVVRGLLLIMA